MHSDGVFSSLLPPTSIIFFKSQYTSCYKVSHLGNWLISHSKSHSYSYYCNIPISNFILPFSSWIAAFQLKWLLFSCHFPSLDSQIFPLHCQYLNNFHLRLLAFRFLSLLSRLSFFHGCFLNFLFIFILVANLFDWLFFISGRHLCQSCTSHVRSFFFYLYFHIQLLHPHVYYRNSCYESTNSYSTLNLFFFLQVSFRISKNWNPKHIWNQTPLHLSALNSFVFCPLFLHTLHTFYIHTLPNVYYILFLFWSSHISSFLYLHNSVVHVSHSMEVNSKSEIIWGMSEKVWLFFSFSLKTEDVR